MNNKDEDIFLKSIKGVKPIKKRNIVQKKIIKTPKHTIKKALKNKEAKIKITEEIKISKTTNTKFSIEKGKTNRALRRGSIPIDKKIDFHGTRLADAEIQFINTITKSFKQKKRCILFITGKGLNI